VHDVTDDGKISAADAEEVRRFAAFLRDAGSVTDRPRAARAWREDYARAVAERDARAAVATRLSSSDLAVIRGRYELARAAGTDAEDAGNGWDPAKIRAVIASWQDVSVLYDEVLRLTGGKP
jgi:hypothetical protein